MKGNGKKHTVSVWPLFMMKGFGNAAGAAGSDIKMIKGSLTACGGEHLRLKRRKTGLLFPIICLCVVLLMGCHRLKEVPKGTEQICGEIYDTGQFQVLVPQPWHVLPITDPFAEGRPLKTDCVFLRKGGQSDWKVTEKPYIRIECYDLDTPIQMQIPEEDLQHDAQTIVPLELGELVWQGYTADSYQGRAHIGRFAVLWAEDEVYKYQVFVWFKSGGESISLEDRDLQAILASVTHATQ